MKICSKAAVLNWHLVEEVDLASHVVVSPVDLVVLTGLRLVSIITDDPPTASVGELG
jgi:hypothetical protein